jgi:hypothetical protein
MRSANLGNQALRHSESGQVWEEVLTNAQGTFTVQPFQTFRVRATGATTVTIDGTLSMTMSAGEIEKFNAGSGLPSGNPNFNYPPGQLPPQRLGNSCTIIIAGAAAFVQVARDNTKQPYGGA